MSKSKSKKAKAKKQKGGKTFKITRKQIVVAAVIVAALVLAGVTGRVVRRQRNKNMTVGFYGLSENYITAIQENLDRYSSGLQITYKTFDEFPEAKKIQNACDLLFMWEGRLSDELGPQLKVVPRTVNGVMPSAIRGKEKTNLPVLLNHYEVLFSTEKLAAAQEQLPRTFEEFLALVETMKDYVFSPFFCNGGDDRTLISLIGAFVEAEYGAEAYTTLTALCRKNLPFEELLDQPLDGKGGSLRQQLDRLITWQKTGLVHPVWFNANKEDVSLFMRENFCAVVFMTLEEHRAVPLKIIRNFTNERLPVSQVAASHGIIAPPIVCLRTSGNPNNESLMKIIVSERAQSNLSNRTKLAPVHSQAEVFDRQADDVRFMAASNPKGPLPDLYTAAFQGNSAQASAFATNIRNYLK